MPPVIDGLQAGAVSQGEGLERALLQALARVRLEMQAELAQVKEELAQVKEELAQVQKDHNEELAQVKKDHNEELALLKEVCKAARRDTSVLWAMVADIAFVHVQHSVLAVWARFCLVPVLEALCCAVWEGRMGDIPVCVRTQPGAVTALGDVNLADLRSRPEALYTSEHVEVAAVAAIAAVAVRQGKTDNGAAWTAAEQSLQRIKAVRTHRNPEVHVENEQIAELSVHRMRYLIDHSGGLLGWHRVHARGTAPVTMDVMNADRFMLDDLMERFSIDPGTSPRQTAEILAGFAQGGARAAEGAAGAAAGAAGAAQ